MLLKKLASILLMAGLSTIAYADNETATTDTKQEKTEASQEPAAPAAKIMYVKDNGDYYLRGNPSKTSALKGSVKAGDPVKVLDHKNGFYFIEDLKGRQKWIDENDVQEAESHKIQVVNLKKANEELKDKLANIDSAQARELKDVKQKYNLVSNELAEAKKTLASQKEQLDKITQENKELSHKIENSEQEKQIRWAKIGALLVGSGLLAGIILVYLPRPQRRRKDIW